MEGILKYLLGQKTMCVCGSCISSIAKDIPSETRIVVGREREKVF
ncbi:MAG: hypothetical protein N3A01_09230 [Bacteroidales bacterium]|nr:hypothetical protein [Bacteroidales bacterium]